MKSAGAARHYELDLFRFLAAPTRAVPRLIFLRMLQGIAALTAVSGLIAAAGQAYYQHPWFYVRGWLCSSPDAHQWLGVLSGPQFWTIGYVAAGLLSATVFATLADILSRIAKREAVLAAQPKTPAVGKGS